MSCSVQNINYVHGGVTFYVRTYIRTYVLVILKFTLIQCIYVSRATMSSFYCSSTAGNKASMHGYGLDLIIKPCCQRSRVCWVMLVT